MNTEVGSQKPWYKHFWPSFIVIMLTLIVAGDIYCVSLALRYPDPEVSQKVSQTRVVEHHVEHALTQTHDDKL